jgi:hypothetical protein
VRALRRDRESTTAQPPPKYTLQKLIGPTQLLALLPWLYQGQPCRYVPLAVMPVMPGPSPEALPGALIPALAGCALDGCALVDWADALVTTPVSASAAADVVIRKSFRITSSFDTGRDRSDRPHPSLQNLVKKAGPAVHIRYAISNPHDLTR